MESHTVQFRAALVSGDQHTRPAAVTQALLEQIGLRTAPPELAVLCLSGDFAGEARKLAASVAGELRPRVLLGCTAESVLGSAREVERAPAASLLVADMPNVTVTPFALSASHLSEWSTILGDADFFADALGMPQDPVLFIVLADPYSTPIDATGEMGISVLQAFNSFYPGVPVVGGMASTGPFPGSNTLILNDSINQYGMVGVALSGDIDIDVIVSQGCRPIGVPHTVTSARQNSIMGLDGEKPVVVIQHMVERLDEEDRKLLQTGGLYIGRAVRGGGPDDAPGRGDFLVRGVMGSDSRTGAIMIGDATEPGSIVQFHVRDARTAEEDLSLSLAPQAFADMPAGGLLFTCNGRGTRLFDHPNADVSLVQSALADEAPVPLGGLFCAGEIGPVNGRNYLHAHTASLVLFRARPA